MEIHPSLWTQLIEKLVHRDLTLYDHVIAAAIVFLILVVLATLVKSRMSLIPNVLQQLMEVTVQGLCDMMEDNIGEGARKYLPLIGGLAFFIFASNFLGMIPSFSAATSNFNTTVACALIVFLYYNFQGLKEHGAGYLKHFMGPIPWLAPLMFPIEIISHLARPFSLAIRLFGNIGGEHMVSLVFYSMIPWLLPVPLMALGLFAAFLQTFVFIMLTQIYIAGSIAHDH
jgi:F-type H+-transporting ATPase subunit a